MILIAVRLWKPQTRLPWYLFALGQALFVAGDVITYNYDRFFGTELPFPSIGDVFYLSVYPCLVVGILLLVRRGNPGGDRDSVIDSLIVAIGVGTISWVFLLSPLAHDSASTLLQKLTAMGYPVADLILLTVVVRLAIGGGPPRRRLLPDGRRGPGAVRDGLPLQLHLRAGDHVRRPEPATSRPAGPPSTSCGARRLCTDRCERCRSGSSTSSRGSPVAGSRSSLWLRCSRPA